MSKPVLGIINQPYTGEVFVGGLGTSEFFRDGFATEMRSKNTERLEDCIMCTTFPEIGSAVEKSKFDKLNSAVKLTRYGLDCYAFGLLAKGHIDIVVEAGLKSYDIQAPQAVIKAAGGVVTNWRGDGAENGGNIIASCNERIHEQALKILSTL